MVYTIRVSHHPEILAEIVIMGMRKWSFGVGRV